MDTQAYINAISYYLPKNSLSNEEINDRFPEWSIDKISSKTGIYNRYISAEDEFASDLAVNAAERLFAEYSIDRSKIDFLIYCTQSPDFFLPTTACILQDRLNLSTGIGAFDINLGCSGYVYGLSIAKSLVISKMASNVLLITSETYSKFIHPKDKSNVTIFGDAASASLISNEAKGFLIENFVYGTDGKGSENLIVKNGGLRNFRKISEPEMEEDNLIKSDNHLYMNGAEVFNFTANAVPRLVTQVLEKNSLILDNIDFFVFHQANKYMLNYIRKKIGILEEKFFFHLENCGNTVSSTIPIALYELKKKEIFEDHKKHILLAGFGVGYSWCGCTIRG